MKRVLAIAVPACLVSLGVARSFSLEGEGGPKDRMRGGGLRNCQDRQLYPLTPTLSHWERGQFRIALGYLLSRHHRTWIAGSNRSQSICELGPDSPLAAVSCSQAMPSCTASGSPHMSASRGDDDGLSAARRGLLCHRQPSLSISSSSHCSSAASFFSVRSVICLESLANLSGLPE